jgi:hypothetical protein
MVHKIIQTENYLLVVDESDIDIGQLLLDNCYVYCDLGYIEKVMDIINMWVYHTNTLGKNPIKHYKKIISHLPISNSPLLEGVDLLPPLEDDVYEYEMAQEYAINSDSPSREARRKGFIDGYNKAKEKYKYTDEDLRRAIEMARTLVDGKYEIEVENILGSSDGTYGIKQKYTEDKIIQSLQQPKIPVGFECEMGKIYGCEDPKICLRECHLYDNSCKHPKIDKTKPKTITNSERKIQWVGKYVY